MGRNFIPVELNYIKWYYFFLIIFPSFFDLNHTFWLPVGKFENS